MSKKPAPEFNHQRGFFFKIATRPGLTFDIRKPRV